MHVPLGCMCLDTEGKQRRGRLKIAWLQMVEKEKKQMGKAWGGIQAKAKDQQIWKDYITALHVTWHNGAKVTE